MEIIDKAFEDFKTLKNEISSYSDTIFSEEDTRIKVIDRILINILGWTFAQISTEARAGKGFLDYVLKVNDSPRLILEAKRDGRDLGIEKDYSGRHFKLNGPVFKSEHVQEGIDQAIYYCAHKSTELACVTNGRQWVIFRGNRLGDGKDVLSGVAFVFSSLDSIEENFKLFFNLLHFENLKSYKFKAFFQEAEGDTLRTKKFKQYMFQPELKTLLPRGQHAQDFDKVMNLFFKRISGDDDSELLINCFVHTKESELASKKLGRISEDLMNSIRKINTEDGDYLKDIVERVKSTNRNEFVIIIGGKGAGKSTFIERFFKIVLPKTHLDEFIQIRINLAESEGDESKIVDWLNTNLLEISEKEVFNGFPTFDELQGMFYHEYERWRTGTYKPLYETDKVTFKIQFGKHIEERREHRPQEYIKRIIGDIVKSRKKVPCIIFDNADHFSIEFQEKVFQYARSIYEEEICLVIIPITDKTSWQLSKQGALQSFDNEALFLPTPSPRKIIESRIKYISSKIKCSKNEEVEYFVGKGIKLSIHDLSNFVASLQDILLSNKNVSTWLGNLANLDIRRCLELTRELIASPHLNFEDFLKIYFSGKEPSIKEYLIIQALIRSKYNIYPVGEHKFIQNIYSISDDFHISPLFCLRILQLLIDKENSKTTEDNYIGVDQVISYFSALGIDNHITYNYLEIMLRTGLCYSYDPTIKDLSETKKIQLSPSGKQHYFWGLFEDQYMKCMLEVTPILEEDVFYELNKFKNPRTSSEWNNRLFIFINYVIMEDLMFCKIPKHEAYEGQDKIIRIFESRMKKISKYLDNKE